MTLSPPPAATVLFIPQQAPRIQCSAGRDGLRALGLSDPLASLPQTEADETEAEQRERARLRNDEPRSSEEQSLTAHIVGELAVQLDDPAVRIVDPGGAASVKAVGAEGRICQRAIPIER